MHMVWLSPAQAEVLQAKACWPVAPWPQQQAEVLATATALLATATALTISPLTMAALLHWNVEVGAHLFLAASLLPAPEQWA